MILFSIIHDSLPNFKSIFPDWQKIRRVPVAQEQKIRFFRLWQRSAPNPESYFFNLFRLIFRKISICALISKENRCNKKILKRFQ